MPHSKKVLAVAVAGALSMPAAVALAQTSTVQIGGGFNLLYYQYSPNNPSTGKKGDVLEQSEPEFRFRGEEKLGGGLSAWFQCASQLDGMTGGFSNEKGFCNRNSAIGIKGSFGNVFAGNWDMPQKLTVNQVRGWFSGTNALWGGSARALYNGSSSGQTSPNTGNTVAGAATNGQNQTAFYRRQAQSISYHSPRFSGFQFMAGYSAANETTGIPEAAPFKPRMFSLAGHYTSGPLWLGVAYEQHKDYNPGATTVAAGAASGYTGGTDHNWTIGARYTFAGVFRLSGSYATNEYETSAAGTLKTKGYSVHADWRVQGPHSIKAQYAAANSPTGSTSMTVGSYASKDIAANLGSTGADYWTLAYTYDFSKRTRGVVAYNHVSNDAGAKFSLGKTAATLGGSQKAIGIGMQHRF